MNETTTATPDNPNPPINKSLLAQELIWTLGSLLTGLLILPALIYAVGVRMFGVYKSVGATTGLAAFYADYAHDIVAARLTACTLAIGPLVLVYLVRLALGHVPLKADWLRKLLNRNTENAADSEAT
ncbi:MAG TPA: hypothetical protein VHL14_13865 [Steroidobacteraceae bacterium]|nr:hypothetical protein [Steroidobacteraceae bacterium]